ncbi:hypothetical protein Tco_1344595 [Tanacetum coccineum]
MNTVRKARITWDVEGDENSKFFHGILKQKRQQQMVKGIMIDGEWITKHHQVKMAFFKFNKDKFEDHDSEMNLGSVMPQVMLDVNDSNELEALVTVDEIKASVWDSGSQKAQGPEGFSFLFLKLYWELLKSDVEASMGNFFYTFVMPKAKILAIRLEKVVDKVVIPEQSAFISGRQILDGPIMLSEIMVWYKKRNQISSVLVNESPTSEFPIKRGLRQGDPLSSFLFIIVMEGLHVALQDAIDLVMDNIICVLHVFYLTSDMVPFTYLGLPIGSNMNLITNWHPLIDHFHKKLSSWKANLLYVGGRLTLIKAVLGSIGIYYLSIFKFLKSVLKSLESHRVFFFWGGSGDQNKMAWIKWDNILASYEKGGLNIGSLKAFNLSFLQKWRWRLMTKPNSLWVRVIKAIHGDDTRFDQNECKISVGNCSSIRFWKDNWIGNGSLHSKYNRLFHLDIDANRLLSGRISNGIWSWNWSRQNLGSRNEEALENLFSEVVHVSVNNSLDSWQWSIANDGVLYSYACG